MDGVDDSCAKPLEAICLDLADYDDLEDLLNFKAETFRTFYGDNDAGRYAAALARLGNAYQVHQALRRPATEVTSLTCIGSGL